MERNPKGIDLPRWMLKYINREHEQIRVARIMDTRYYPKIMDLGPDEISRYILDFIYPIHKPPTKYQIWKQNRKKKWCNICGDPCHPLHPTCQICQKPFSWVCENCRNMTHTNVCKPRLYPPDPEDSDYELSD